MFSRIADVISSHLSGSQSSSSSSSVVVPHMFPSANNGGGGGGGGGGHSQSSNKNYLRLSSSLQDFSAYRPLEPDINIGNNNNHLNYPHLLHRDSAAVSSFSKEKGLLPGGGGTPSKRYKCLRFLMFTFFFFFLALLIYFVSLYVYSYWSQGPSKFYVVLDCGSTGTRVYVYQASLDHKTAGTLPIALTSITEGIRKKPTSQIGRAYDRMETEPGFHKLVHNVSGLKGAIKPLVRWAEKQIPKNAHKTTSLFLYATAGVRRLPTADSKWLLDNAWSILKSSRFLCRRDWVKIISGPEEAYFGWIALNHRTGMLGVTPKKPTYGALDLGGSSLQVTFESKERVHNETSLNLRIGAVNHHLTAYSLSGYGLNDAFDKSVAQLFMRLPEITKGDPVNKKIELKHPCLNSGYREQYICSQCALNYKEAGSPVITGKKLGKEKSGIAVQLVGAPNWEQCSALAKVAVNLSEWSNQNTGIDCDLQPCALPESFPRPYGQFYAMSGFFVVYRFFNLTSEAALDDVLEKGQEFCEKTWEVARNSVAPQPFIEQYCFRAPYIVFLLREGLHITDNQVIIGSGSITWTLGVALLEAGKAFSSRMRLRSYEIFQMKINPIILIAILFVSLVLLVFALSCAGKWMPRFSRRSYLPLFRHNSASATSVLNMSSPFGFQRWSPISSGDGRVKMPLSPTAQERPFGFGHGLSGGSSSSIQLTESSLYPSTSGVLHSYSSSNLGQMQFDGNSMGSFWSPHRSQTRLQSRRSQSREDLNSSVAEAYMVKV